jgi:NTP pyrophosphatase (non-canonical NTP hydrolase)
MKQDKRDRIGELLAELQAFIDERHWDRFHTPKNLVMALTAEVGELTEHFMWLEGEQSTSLPSEQLEDVAGEIGDVLIYLLHLCRRLGIDPVDAAFAKLAAARVKYPASAARAAKR